MSEEIKIDETLIKVFQHVSKACEYCNLAYNNYSSVLDTFSKEYEGKTTENSALFLNSAVQQIGKLIMFYSVTSQFIMDTFIEMLQKDKEIAKLLQEEFGE